MGATQTLLAYGGPIVTFRNVSITQLHIFRAYSIESIPDVGPVDFTMADKFRGVCNTVVPPYSRLIRSKTYRCYVKPRIMPNAIYNVIFV
jgi:hypothetical protein